VTGSYGIDTEYIDRVLTWAFQRIAVDPTRLAIAGFSDGGTYSLHLGIRNGDLFTRIAALAPCSGVPENPVGKPAIFIAHGTHDAVLPIAGCSAVTVPELRLRGYTVEFAEYPSASGDGHFVPPEVAARAFAWLAAP
jgi:phospholipase/carboxylesterase